MKRSVHQAQVSKEEADANITRKLNVLNGWLANGIPFLETSNGSTLLDKSDRKQLDFYPTSLRQFKAWDGSQNCESVRTRLPFLTATGNDTLAKRPSLQEQARRVVEALGERAELQINSTRAAELKRLTVELRIAHATIEIRNAELREQQRTLRAVERTNATLSQKVSGDAVEFKRTYDALLAELEVHKVENAQLIAQLAKLSPLRSSSGT